MSTCPICERDFDEHAYQLVISGAGAFDSIECLEEALRREARKRRRLALLDDPGETAEPHASSGPTATAGADHPAR